MYRFLMVDDEDIIREGFRERIDWAGLGYEFLEPCKDGREAVEAIGRQRPHVVMTDIYMPFMDGIALSAWIAANYPDILVLVLSGYDDFEYARASIRNKVNDYILKPITANELREVLKKVHAKLDENAGQIVPRSSERDFQLQSILEGGSGMPDARVLETRFGNDAAQRFFVVVRLEVACPENEADSARERDQASARLVAQIASVVNPLGQELTPTCAVLAEPFGGRPLRSLVDLIFHDPSSERVEKLADFFARQLIDVLGKNGFRASAGIGAVHQGPAEVSLSAREAQMVAEYRIINGRGLYHYQSSRENATAPTVDVGHYSKVLVILVRTGSQEEIAGLIREIRQKFAVSQASIRRLKQDIQTIFFPLLDLATGSADHSDATSSDGLELFYHITDYMVGLDDLELHLATLCAKALETVYSGGAGNAERKVLEFQDYVAAHFAEQDLSITKVSGVLAVSPSYLSKILKRQLDRSFVEYLTEFRLDRAKEMLVGSDRMTYEIAEASGYHDA